MVNEFVGWGGWSFYGPENKNSLIQKCGTETIFGGYGKMGNWAYVVKNFYELPIHTAVEVTLKLFFVDTWDGETFYVQIDYQNKILLTNNYRDHSGDVCGAIDSDYIIPLVTSGQVAHTSSSMRLQFDGTLDQSLTDESWGIKNLKIYLTNNCPNSCITCSLGSCTTCPSFAKLVGTSCICKDDFYMVTSPYTRCEKCAISCKTCNAVGCLTCYPEYTLINGVCSPPTSI